MYEGIVLHDQVAEAENGEWHGNEVAERHRLPTGQKVKTWYGKFLIYGNDQEGKEVNLDLHHFLRGRLMAKAVRRSEEISIVQ